jgi:hypothetical protein
MNEPAQQTYRERPIEAREIHGLADGNHKRQKHPDCDAKKDGQTDAGNTGKNPQHSGSCGETRSPKNFSEVGVRFAIGHHPSSDDKRQSDPDNPGDKRRERDTHNAGDVSYACAPRAGDTGIMTIRIALVLQDRSASTAS